MKTETHIPDASCASTGTNTREGYNPFTENASPPKPAEKPPIVDGRIQLLVFGGTIKASEFCQHLYEHLRTTGQAYLRDGQVVCLSKDASKGLILERLKPTAAISWLEKFAEFMVPMVTEKGQVTTRPTVLKEPACRAILDAEQRRVLPPLEAIVSTPILCDIDGQVVCVGKGYCRERQLYVAGDIILPTLSVDDAIANLWRLLKDYKFTTPSDKARAIASLLTPGFKLGGFIKGHVPADLVEANHPQSGKTLLSKVKAAIYGEKSHCVAPKFGGVGSADESISALMIAGKPFILLDNWRGALDSSFLESVLTGEQVVARAPRISMEVDASMFLFSITSNGISSTVDLCERVNLIRLRKRHGFRFPAFDEGSLEAHVRANHAKYLGSVHAIIRSWVEDGRPQTDENRHSFRAWASTMDWLVRNYFGLPPLLDGLSEALEHIKHPSISTLRLLCLALEQRHLLDQALKAHHLADIAIQAGIKLDGREDDAIKIYDRSKAVFEYFGLPFDAPPPV